jgi:hypothetical protein
MSAMELSMIEVPVDETYIQTYLFETKGWIDFYNNNLDILSNIVKIFNQGTYGFIRHNSMLGLTTQYISLALDKPIIYIRHMLSLWFTHYCTFYAKYGRVHYVLSKKIWVYEPKS